MSLTKLFPFLRWLPPSRENLRADLIAGITVAMVLVPQSMAYATLAGLPVVYGLYASFLPVVVASMWGASRFLHTGPVAMLSLMSAAAIEPLATRGSEEFIQFSLTLALLVGVLRLLLGLFRMGVLINLASHPVIVGFTNAAALIIGLSLVNSFLNVPMPRSDTFLLDLWQVVEQVPIAHTMTLIFALGTLLVLKLMRQHFPSLPGVLIVVIMAIVISKLIGFEQIQAVSPQQVVDTSVRDQFEQLVANQAELKKIKQEQQAINNQLESDIDANKKYNLQARLLRLQGEEKGLKYSINKQQVSVYQIALVPQTLDDGRVVFKQTRDSGFLSQVWRWSGTKDDQFKLSGGGRVVGSIPSGVPSFSLPLFDFGLISGLFATAFIMAMIGFMEATSISRALAAKTREKLDPNQELIGQGLANIVGSFFQSYTVSGSFSRSAVAARVGARTGFYAIISALGVTLVMLFLTEYLYHLPMAVLAAIVMSAVFSLIDVKSLMYALKVRKADGIVGIVTFFATLIMAPKLADGVIIGVILTVIVFLTNTMKPRSEVMGLTTTGSLAGAITHDLAPVSKHFVVLRFDASLVFINAAHFEQAILKALNEFPESRAILVLGHGINWIDATGVEKIRAMGKELSDAGVTLALAGFKQPVREALEKVGLDQIIGAENIFPSKNTAIRELEARYAGL